MKLYGLKHISFMLFTLSFISSDLFTGEKKKLLYDLSRLLQRDIQENVHLQNNRKKKFRILCFGDSLTQGYYGVYKQYHPYSIMLNKLLLKNYGDNYDVVTSGVGGEKVYKEMPSRLSDVLKDDPYDLALIMGGVNDLTTLDCINKIDLFKEIINLHKIAYNKGIKTVVMTMLPAHVADYKLVILNQTQFQSTRSSVNEKLRNFKSNSSILCDVAQEFPLEGLSRLMKKRLWTKDNVHPSPQGYDELGRIIFECINSKIDLPSAK